MRGMHYGRRAASVIMLAMVSMLGSPSRGQAAQLVFPAAGPEEGSLAGNAVALPLNPISALFHNPAQLTLLPHSVTMGLLAVRYHPRYTNPLGYDNTSRELPISPSFGYATNRWAPFHVGIGMYGALGFAYNFDAEPERGVPNNFFTELAVISLAPAVAYSLAPNLHLGFAINPSYGRLRLKTPSPVGRIDTDTRGPGIFSTVGLMYTPTSKLDLGIGYKTPGIILMRGNARVAGRGDDAKVDFHLPQTLEFGAAYHVTERLTVTTQGRWTEYAAFEDTRLEFDHNTSLNRSAVDDARNRLRVGAGMLYELLPGLTLHTGFSWERWAIKASSLAPTLPSLTEYYLLNLGISIERGPWRFHLATGYAYAESRRVTADRNPFFAGRYSLQQAIFGVQVTRRLGEDHRVAASDNAPPPPVSFSDKEQEQVHEKNSRQDLISFAPGDMLFQPVSFNSEKMERTQEKSEPERSTFLLPSDASSPRSDQEQRSVQAKSDQEQWVRLCDLPSYETGRCTP